MDYDQSSTFWAELSACEHFVQIYDTEDTFMDTLAGFVSGGIKQGHAAVVIATAAHRQELERRLEELGIDVATAHSKDQFISLDAEETLAKFMVNDWPDDAMFETVITDILARAGHNGRKVRAFREMVALMWAKGYCGATVRLENMWQHFCERESLPLFCAYPRSGFTENPSQSISHICAQHSKVFPV